MAGMLPGVECARRRRLHQSGGCSDSPASTRRSSFCLYTTSHVHDHSLSSSSSSSSSSSLLQQRSLVYQACPDEMLEGAAREAKERLDEKLRAQRNSQTKSSSREGRKAKEERREAELQIEVYGRKRSGCRRLMGWSRLKLKLKWKAPEEEDCAVCLESFKAGDTLIHLPCAHRFHSTCLDPWLQHSAHCPCCRMTIISN